MRWLCLLMITGCLVPDEVVATYLDADGDGALDASARGGTDCDDGDATIGPHAAELCNGIDDDCDGRIDEQATDAPVWFEDLDGDGFAGDASTLASCTAPDGAWSDAPTDCDDRDASSFPGAIDRCDDGIDNDCDGAIDEDGAVVTVYDDVDGDGHGDPRSAPRSLCHVPAGTASLADDCDDRDASVFPGAADPPYDGVDSACDGDVGEFDADGDGYETDPALVTAPGWQASTAVDCDDDDPALNPQATEVCYDAVDQDCDGSDLIDCDGDGFDSAEHGGTDCDDTDAATFPGAVDPPRDGVDSDCDPTWDDDVDRDGHLASAAGGDDCDDDDPELWSACETCIDADGDGAWTACDSYLTREEDCDDTDPAVSPGAPERFGNGIDEDCSGADLGEDPSEGTWVSPEGTDTPGCGALAAPCATVAGTDGSGPVFLTEGVHAPFVATVSVYGGFSSVSGVHDPATYPSIVQTTGGPAIQLDSVVAELGTLSVRATDAVLDVELVDLTGGQLTVFDLSLSTEHTTRTCLGLRADVQDLEVDRLDLRGCASTLDSTGLDLTVDDASLNDLDLQLAGSGFAAVATGILQRGSGELAIRDSTVMIEGHWPGRALTLAGNAVLLDSTLTVAPIERGFGPQPWAVGGRVGTLSMVRSRLSATLGPAASLTVDGRAEFASSVLRSDQTALELSGAGHASLVGLLLQGADGLALEVEAELYDVLLIATGAALSGEGSVALHGVLFDAPVLWRGDGTEVRDEATLAACTWGGCNAGETLVFGPAGLAGSGDDLLPTSPAVDAGVQPPAWATEVSDIHGRPRPVGVSWDIGPYELN